MSKNVPTIRVYTDDAAKMLMTVIANSNSVDSECNWAAQMYMDIAPHLSDKQRSKVTKAIYAYYPMSSPSFAVWRDAIADVDRTVINMLLADTGDEDMEALCQDL